MGVTYRELVKRAKKMGYELTPQLKSELRILADVPDEDIQAAYESAVTSQLAEEFGVPKAAMERRIEGAIPKLPL